MKTLTDNERDEVAMELNRIAKLVQDMRRINYNLENNPNKIIKALYGQLDRLIGHLLFRVTEKKNATGE